MRYDFTVKCRGCGEMCDGTMRQIHRVGYETVRRRIDEQAPKLPDGRFQLCHTCQFMCDARGIESRLLTKFMQLANRLWITENFRPGHKKRPSLTNH